MKYQDPLAGDPATWDATDRFELMVNNEVRMPALPRHEVQALRRLAWTPAEEREDV